MTARDMTDDDLRTYGFNLRTALETLEDELADSASRQHLASADLEEIIDPETDDEEAASLAVDTEEGEVEEEPFEDPVADHAFMDDFLGYFSRVREELDLLLKQYEDLDSDYQDAEDLEGVHDPVEISADTGMPVYTTSHHSKHGLSDIRMDMQEVDDSVRDLAEAFQDYVEGKDWEDEHDLASRDVREADREAFNALFEDLESTAQLDILSGDFPEFQHTHVFNVEYWNDLDDLDVVKRGEKNIDVVEDDGESRFFTLNTADFSAAKEDSFLFYTVGGVQEQDKKWYHFRKDLPIMDDDGYKISAELNEAFDHAFDWSPERVLHNFNLLGEKADVTYGENIETGTAEMVRMGPFYFQGMTRPPTPEQGVEMTSYDTVEELKEADPASYVSAQIGEFLEDNPDQYVLTLERRRATKTPDDETQTATELVFVTPDSSRLQEYVPDEIEGEDEQLQTTVFETDLDSEAKEELASLYDPSFDPEEDGYMDVLDDRPGNYRPFEDTVGDDLEEQVVSDTAFEDDEYQEEVIDE